MLSIIFRCSKKNEMYLYLPYEAQKDEQVLIDDLPAALRQLTGRLEKVMELEITPDRKLARANAQEVLDAMAQQGFYLQMPPNEVFKQDIELPDGSDGF